MSSYRATMAIDPGALETTLAAFVGDDPALAADLRCACIDALGVALGELEAAPDIAAWRRACERIEGIAASFGVVRLMESARDAGAGAPDARIVVRLRRAVARLA